MPVRKVLHVIPSVGPLRGGPSVMVNQLARSLARSGVETHVATTDDNGPGKLSVRHGEPVIQDGVSYWYFPRQLRFYTTSWPLSAWLSNSMAGFDLLHIHALFSFAALPASFWAVRRRVPYVVRPLGTLNEWGMTHRRPWLKRASFRLVESRILAGAALVHYTSEQERREAKALGVSTQSAVIPNPLPESPCRGLRGAFRARYKELNGRRIILFLSRLDQKKGLDLLLRAFAEVRQEGWDAALVVAGEGEPRFTEALKVDAGNLGIAGDVLWTGFLTGDAKQAAFADADLFVLPSYSENFGIAVAEAMAAGVPVLVTDQVGIGQQIAMSASGLVVRCDARELALGMTRLLGDPDLCRSMGENGRQLAATKYSQDAVTGMMLDAYNRIAG
jgi:glycosyltransferase involved in cell wall biosynthesis